MAKLCSETQMSETVIDPSSGTSRVRQPKRILHFCDGTLEEYSTDEDETDNNSSNEPEVDPAVLPWKPWFLHKTFFIGTKVLNAVDYMGESLARFFGLLTPKYNYEIEHGKQEQAEMDELQRKEDLESASWATSSSEQRVIDSQAKVLNANVEVEKY